ncbi:hypothetical protein MBM09_04555 [Flaviramulus sp. BrNp1-15]|uniref:hypothetical protein n=1 Tax=Flaviramulus sp. BrNp1-15 TaxID=2916754 RepID=UPI001EE7AE75|nr:hypothetical protein [Flaviramulus sp. BrNp1-15]ULC60263.1 hypothetical protein MBM09_04555 [Flaviramulus sp. BrNp1-15]
MYKLNYLFLFFAMTLGCFAQSKSTNVIPGITNITIGSTESKSLFGLNIIEYGRGGTNSKNSGDVEGSTYLFKGWYNKSTIWLNDKIFNINSINYNLENEKFEIKLNNDSILIVNPAINIKKVKINNIIFKPFYNEDLQKDSFFEVLWSSDDYSLLSNYKLKIQAGDIDPLTKTYINQKKYTQKKYYFLKKNNEEKMVAIKLKKSEVLKLIDTYNVDKVKSFVKKRRLKYNRISDVKDMLTYYNSIKN